LSANFFLSLGVLLLYVSWFLVYQPAELGPGGDWGFGLSRIEVTTFLVLGGLLLCWRANSRTARIFGAFAIFAGFVLVYPGVLFSVEYVEDSGVNGERATPPGKLSAFPRPG
jgi:hypothetical protein